MLPTSELRTVLYSVFNILVCFSSSLVVTCSNYHYQSEFLHSQQAVTSSFVRSISLGRQVDKFEAQ